MAFRLVVQWATDAARVMVRAPKQIREYCRRIPVGPEGDYRREVNAFNQGFVAVGVLHIIWAPVQYVRIISTSSAYLDEYNRKLEKELKMSK